MASAALPTHLQAKTALGDRAAFMSALEQKPWLLGYLGASEIEMHANMRIVSGKVPRDLQGNFFRNGPAMHDIGSDRFLHWFDAPGMIQRFSFSDGTVNHHGRMIETARNLTEISSKRIQFTSFGSHGHGLTTGGAADNTNPANISLLNHAGELLALWEGGAAHVIDPQTLETKSRKTWSPETEGLPFGAHPRVDTDGSVWNIGYSVAPAALILYHISASGKLLQTHIIPQKATPMVHDFMITQSKIVIVLPPFGASNMSGSSFVNLFEWAPDQPTQILVVDKDDLSSVTRVEMDPFWVFHFGNAYDISAHEIGFDFAQHDSPEFMTLDAFAAMDGSWDGAASAASRYASARVDLNLKNVQLEQMPEYGQAEFIQTDARAKLSDHRYALMLSQPGGAAVFGFTRLALVDRESGKADSYDLGDTEILEEHLIVPKPKNSSDFWIMGTSLDWARGTTSLSLYEGLRLSDGPVMKAELDIALPLGLHGTFIPA